MVILASIVFILVNPNLFGKLWKIIIHNPEFWILAFAGLAYGVWRKCANPIEFKWQELLAHFVIGCVSLIGVFSTFLYLTTGLHDTELHNGYAKNAEYYESWTEIVHYTETETSGSGKDQTSRIVYKTRYDYHPPYWTIETTDNGSIGITQEEYRRYVSQFQNESKVHLSRLNQVSFGDGDKYETTWSSGNESLIVPSASEHQYVNYLKASNSIFKRLGVIGPNKKFLLSYPRVESGLMGDVEVNRVLVSGVLVPEKWKKIIDRELDVALASLGSKKQVNLLLYVVGTSDRGFLHELEEHWTFGKKNDVVLVLGMKKFPVVQWSGVMIFHGNEKLKVKLRNAIPGQSDVSDAEMLSSIFINNVKADFRRVPMAELEYMLYDVHLPWWALMSIFILQAALVVGTGVIFENN